MDIITHNELLVLSAHDKPPCITIFLPAAEGRPEERDRARLSLKSMLRDGRTQLRREGWRTPDIDELLRPAAAKLDQAEFWRRPGAGVAIFVAPDFARSYQLPIAVEPQLIVAPRFFIRPLLSCAANDARFYLLALSQNHVRLYLADRYRVREMALEGVPTSIEEALAFEDPERQLQSHVTRPGARGSGALTFHGHAPTEEDKDRLLRYCRAVATSLQSHLRVPQTPLVLAAVQYLQALFRQVNIYPHLLDAGLPGNPDNQTGQALQQAAWPLVSGHLQQSRLEIQMRYRALAGSDQATSRLPELLAAAHTGRIDTLFVPCHAQRWGRYDPATYTLIEHDEPLDNDAELIDLVAIQTLLHGGTVYAAENNASDTPLAAILRY